MGGQSSGVQKANKAAGQASAGLQQAADARMASPIYGQVEGLLQNLLQNPLTYTPAAMDATYQTGVSNANQGAKAFLADKQAMSQAPGGTGYRSGAARDAEFEAGARLGEGLAQAYRQTQLMAASQRIPDLLQAMQAGSGFLSQDFNTAQAVANTKLGQANVLGQTAQIPSPLGQALGGVGSLGGTLGSAAISAPGK